MVRRKRGDFDDHGSVVDARFAAARVGRAYDMVTDDYVDAFADDLWDLPLDREILDAVIARITPGSLVLDLGCGPAPVSSFMGERGLSMVAGDVSGGMLRAARARNPGLRVEQLDMRLLPFADRLFSAVVAFYSVQHVPRASFGVVVGEVVRVLVPGGLFVVAAHLGEGETYVSEFLGHEIDVVGGTFYSRDELITRMNDAGLLIDAERQRDALSHEAPTRRIYITGRLPSGGRRVRGSAPARE